MSNVTILIVSGTLNCNQIFSSVVVKSKGVKTFISFLLGFLIIPLCSEGTYFVADVLNQMRSVNSLQKHPLKKVRWSEHWRDIRIYRLKSSD